MIAFSETNAFSTTDLAFSSTDQSLSEKFGLLNIDRPISSFFFDQFYLFLIYVIADKNATVSAFKIFHSSNSRVRYLDNKVIRNRSLTKKTK